MSITAKHHQYDAIQKAIQSLKAGRLVIVVDDYDRENEGDFICAAETINSSTVDFMLKIGRGMLCVPITNAVAEQLQLHPAVSVGSNTSLHETPFLTQIDHQDSGTGVSSKNRAHTIRMMSESNAVYSEFVRPGHISPLLAKKGGVLRRAGHTEATIDLLRIAKMKPVGALIEICSQTNDGMADFDELQQISKEHDIPIISIEELIRFRRTQEQLIKREAEVDVPTKHYGTPKVIAYSVAHEDQEPLALVWGDLPNCQDAPLVRMHSSCFTGDLLNSLRCDCGDQLNMAMETIYKNGCGAVVYLPQEGRGIGLTAKLKAYQLQDDGVDTVEANHKLGFKADERDYMIGMQILKDLGLTRLRLLSNNPKKLDAFPLSGMDLEVVEQVPIIAPPVKEREQYLATKRDKMGHNLP